MRAGNDSKQTTALHAQAIESGVGEPANDWSEIARAWRTELGVGTALVLLVVLSSFLAPNFLTLGNLSLLLRQTSVVMIIAVGMTFVIIAGEIDLSIGATVGLAGV